MTLNFRIVFLSLIICNCLSAQRVAPIASDNPFARTADNDCNDPTFLKFYGRRKNTDQARDIVATPSNGSIVVGFAGNDNLIASGLVICLDSKGNLIWKKKWGLATESGVFTRVLRLKDNNYLAMGYTSLYDGLFHQRLWLAKFDISGNILFTKYLPIPNAYSTQGNDICETADGGFAIAGGAQTADATTSSMIIRCNSNGDVIWTKSSRNPGYDYFKTFSAIIEHDGNLVVAGYKSAGNYLGLVIKLKSSNGDMLWQKEYMVDAMYARFNNIYENNGSYLIDGSRTTNQSFDNLQKFVLQINTDGSMKKGFLFNPSIKESYEWHAILPLADGSFIATQGPGYTTDILLFKVSGKGDIIWKKKYSQVNYQQIFRLKKSVDNGILGVGTLNYSGACCTPEVIVMKTDSMGQMGQCVSGDPPLQMLSPSVNVSQGSTDLTDFSLGSVPAPVPVSEVDFQTYTVCEPPVLACEVMDITGPSRICSLGDTLTYYGHRSANCITAVKWQANDEYFQVVGTTDSSIQLVLKRTGSFLLQARPDNNCTANFASLAITINRPPAKVDLGPDRKICPANTLTINAGSGFEKYLWNDSSTDSLLVASKPGKYAVTVTDLCGTTYTDETELIQADEPFDLGPDRQVCDNEKLIIRLPQGYTISSWSPHYNSSLYGDTVLIVSPAKDTSYTISSLLYPGCLKSDVVKVSVIFHLPLSLGKDTSLCEGKSVSFTAPSGFASYLWSDNSTGPSISAAAKNIYWLHATAPNGCISADTVAISNTYPKPIIGFADEMQTCEGVDLKIQAPTQFVQYNWQDGSTQNSFVTRQAGLYSLAVTDTRGCSASDSVFVRILALPSGFLDKRPSYEMCENGRPIELSAIGNWKSYAWSNTDRTKVTKARSPGSYALEVADANGCRAKDSLLVRQKTNCLQGMYFPNSFSPNADHINDVFRPIFSIIPESYHLVLYNRFGGKVFESNDPDQGWSGLINGKPADSNNFVWYCTYKFPGYPAQAAKGLVMLIK